MMAKNDLPPVGTELHALRRKPSKERVTASIVEDSQFPGGRAVECAGRRFATLSAAAAAYSRTARNGWVWWRTTDGRPVSETRGR